MELLMKLHARDTGYHLPLPSDIYTLSTT